MVADPRQVLGLGSKIADYLRQIYKDVVLETVSPLMLPDNYHAIKLLKKREFAILYKK